MHQFIHGSPQCFAALQNQLERESGCISFQAQSMPTGSRPASARVGFQKNADSTFSLLVERGVRCPHAGENTLQWLREGELRSPDFATLRDWICSELSADYEITPTSDTTTEVLRRVPTPESLTDLSAVQAQLVQDNAPFDMAATEERLKRGLQQQVRGQTPATATMAFRVARHLARKGARRPLSIFAVGPTGVGKTRSAEVLARELGELEPQGASRRAQGYSYLRLDMSEYQEKHRVSQLLGSPQGYAGYSDGAQLVDALAANPQTVVLLDEIEKAHPDILRALMNALDAGRLSRANGTSGNREIDCRRAIFVFTSNLNDGIEDDLRLWEAIAPDSATTDGDYRRAVEESCRWRLQGSGIAPELIGRIGCFLAFRPLTEGARAEIVSLTIVHAAREYNVEIGRIAPEVVAYILRNGPETDWGTRPDEYFVDELLGDAFAIAMKTTNPGQIFGVEGPPFVCVPMEGEENDGNQSR